MMFICPTSHDVMRPLSDDECTDVSSCCRISEARLETLGAQALEHRFYAVERCTRYTHMCARAFSPVRGKKGHGLPRALVRGRKEGSPVGTPR